MALLLGTSAVPPANADSPSNVTWYNSHQYDVGFRPRVAFDGQSVVEVHQGGTCARGGGRQGARDA